MQEQIVGGGENPASQPEPTGPSEADLERIVASKRARREAKENENGDGEGDRSVDQTLKAAAKGQPVTEPEIHDALEYYFAAEADPETEIVPTPLTLNLGTKDRPKKIRWEILPVPDTEITRIRRESVRGTRAQRRRGDAEVDENLVARKVVALGTVTPDLTALAGRMRVQDPTDALNAYFRKFGKTGLITQISGEILSISGWDDEDIQEAESARG